MTPNVPQIPDAANRWLSRTGHLPPELEAEADEAIRQACDMLRPGKVKAEPGVETTIIKVRECGL